MKQLKHLLLLLALLPGLAVGQKKTVTVEIDLSNYYTKAQTDSVARANAGPIIRPPVIQNPLCEYGPSIVKIESVTAQNAVVNFMGKKAYKFWCAVTIGTDTLVKVLVTPASDRPLISFGRSIPAGIYTMSLKGDSCRTVSWTMPKDFIVPGSTGDTGPPPVVTPGQPNASPDQVGAYTTRFGKRTATYTRSPGLVLAFHEDGTLSDVTPGITFDGTTNIVDGKRRYYQFGASFFVDYDGKYNKFQHVELPDGIFRVIAYDIPNDVAPNQEAFARQAGGGGDHQGGWPNNITVNNSIFHNLDLQISSESKIGNSAAPKWLIVTRKMLFPKYCLEKDWRPYGKWFASETMNWGDSEELYHKLGVNTDREGKMAFSTDKYPLNEENKVKYKDATNDYQWMRILGEGVAARQGNDPQSMWTDEFAENLGGYDVLNYTKYYYKGITDQLTKATGIKDINQFGSFGTYGDESTISKYTQFSQGKENFIRSLSTDAQNTFQYGGNGWIGRDNYYARGDYKYRHVNKKIYMGNYPDDYPYAAFYNNERLQVGTNEYGGRRLIVYSMPIYEDLANNRLPVGLGHSGAIIPFPNGEMLVKTGEYNSSSWDEHFIMTYYYSLIGSGSALWNSPGQKMGSDTTKYWYYGFDATPTWIPKGGKPEPYNPGVNGAPTRGMDGLSSRNHGTPTDATMAAMDLIWDIRDRITDLHLVEYKSNLTGTYTPKGGTLGTRLNGVGKPLNKNFFDLWDLMAQGLGLAIVGTGPAGKVITYYNGKLPVHVYEDVTIMGHTFRSYGRQIYQFKL